jgi:hypothetical protein
MKIDTSKPYAIKYPSPTMETVIENFFYVISFYSLLNIFYDEDTENGFIEFIKNGLYNLLKLDKKFIYTAQSMDVIQHCMMIKSSSMYQIVHSFSRNFNPSNKIYLKNKNINRILMRINYEDIQNKWSLYQNT